ncbi:LysR family transcriptional regulator [Bradyrhizobium sp.]|uniref:LysR family transcriptional regulator n=1 Tax=Bradyrhizobium sp. TaxID=376 RepID=UPI0025C37B1B|nr:LysR family transcriptional regulator [Bradyrhizobium sp.]
MDLDWSIALDGRIKLRNLHVLQAAAETGSMAKAAAYLAITQPAVSYAISELEQAMGVPLLDRTSQGVSPTVYGLALLARSTIVFNELRHGISEIASLADPEVGELRIGTTPPMSAVASAVFNRLAPRYPRMRFELSVAGTDVLLRQLRQRDVEIVISRLAPSVRDDDLRIETLFHDELAVICSRNNKWARQRNVSLADLVPEAWVLPPPTGFLTQVMRAAFEAQGLEFPRATVTTSSTYAMSVLVGNGDFLAIHPNTMLTTPDKHPQLTSVDVRLPTTRGAIGLIALKDRSLSPVAGLFVQSAVPIGKAIQPKRTTRVTRK